MMKKAAHFLTAYSNTRAEKGEAREDTEKGEVKEDTKKGEVKVREDP